VTVTVGSVTVTRDQSVTVTLPTVTVTRDRTVTVTRDSHAGINRDGLTLSTAVAATVTRNHRLHPPPTTSTINFPGGRVLANNLVAGLAGESGTRGTARCRFPGRSRERHSGGMTPP